jgi:hypothetical protein
MSERTTSFWPLPGGHKHYLETLQKFLSKIAEEPTFEELIGWAAKTFGKSPGWIDSSIRECYNLFRSCKFRRKEDTFNG